MKCHYLFNYIHTYIVTLTLLPNWTVLNLSLPSSNYTSNPNLNDNYRNILTWPNLKLQSGKFYQAWI